MFLFRYRSGDTSVFTDDAARLSRTAWRRFKFIACAVLVGLAASIARSDSSAEINTREVLSIGLLNLSQYRLEKNFHRAFEPSKAVTIEPSKTKEWFERFLVQQVVTAQAISEGYAARAEVQREVDR